MKRFIIIVSILTLLASFIIFGLFNASQKRTQFKLGAFVDITLNGPAWTDFDKVFDKAFLAVDKIHNLANIYDENSQLNIINKKACQQPVKIDEDLYNLIEESINISRDTEGAFDITVAPLVELWGFYKKESKFPLAEDIKKTLQNVGYSNIILDKKNNTVLFKKKSIKIDLGAIATGYAVDKAANIIKECGIKSAIINAGGDIYCLGKKNFFRKWKVGIKDPTNNKDIIKIVYLENQAVTTSGGYEKFFEYNGKRYSHLIDPRTGLANDYSSNATVIARTCTEADALATAACILGKDKLGNIKEKYDIEVYIF